ncbi:hypothetical protein ACFL13_01345 [Patescibacteria group bacterium]
MSILGGIKNPEKVNKGAFNILAILFGIGVFLGFLALVFPTAFFVVINFLWIFLILIVTVFLVLGFLVVIGLREEVSKFLDVMLEGSLTIIDAVELIKKLYASFVLLLKDFILFIMPVIASGLSFLIYFGILLLYKNVGKENDVTIMTVILTAVMMVVVAVLNIPLDNKRPDDSWKGQCRAKFKRYFADSFEIIVFIFFLTMDSTNLFFLPKHLNVPIRAHLGSVDLMLRGADVTHQADVTVLLVTIAISIEILRNVIRVVVGAISYFNQTHTEDSRVNHIKNSVRKSFADTKDDLVKFITFTTVLIIVFLFFPRLKLFAMVVASSMGLVLDVIIPARIHAKKGEDLFSRLIVKVFRL